MRRRGFLASLAGLLALKKMPVEEAGIPVVAPPVILHRSIQYQGAGMVMKDNIVEWGKSGTVMSIEFRYDGERWMRAP